MHLVVLFHNVGGYHAARLRAVHNLCQDKGWNLTAVQVTNNSSEHEWGDLSREITFNLKTLLPSGSTPLGINSHQGSVAAVRRMRRFLDETQPNIVAISGWGFSVSRTTRSWAKRHGALAVLMSESKRDDEKRRWWKEQIKSRLYVRQYDAALVGGQLHRDYLVELGFPSERIFFGYDVVDNDYFAERATEAQANPISSRLREPQLPTRPFFLVVSRLIELKNVAPLVEAFAGYRREIGKRESWDLAICGNGEQERHIRDVVRRLQIEDCVHLPGFVGYQRIGDWYGLANAFVHPTLKDAWGLVINEACAAGLPILCSRVAGASHELVRDGKNGWIFDPRSTAEMTDALLKTHRLNQSTRAAFGKKSRRIVAAFSPKLFAANLFKAIDSAEAFRNADLVTSSGEVVSQAR